VKSNVRGSRPRRARSRIKGPRAIGERRRLPRQRTRYEIDAARVPRTEGGLEGARLETREFSPKGWDDFVSLFAPFKRAQAGRWWMFYHRTGPNGTLGSPARPVRNRRDHRALVRRGHAHKILVYVDDRPVGWCQFVRRADLPRLERGRKYRATAPSLAATPNWRSTGFFVDRPYCRRGIARHALAAALRAIERLGGGIVEAYPATHGRAVATWFGAVGMFEREGFRVVGRFGRSNVLVRLELPRGDTGLRDGGPGSE
jgi:GNAT superfamily N-acetyltransferase